MGTIFPIYFRLFTNYFRLESRLIGGSARSITIKLINFQNSVVSLLQNFSALYLILVTRMMRKLMQHNIKSLRKTLYSMNKSHN